MEDNIQEIQHRPTGLRRAFTMRNSVARQAVHFMPSRQLPHNTLRRVNSEHNALLEDMADAASGIEERQVNIIVREMEQHQQLMEDNPEAEELRREALRELPQGLTMKRSVRAKLSASVSNRSDRKPLSMWKRMNYRISFATKRTRDRLKNFIFSIELWYEAIRHIEGSFGSAVGTYFYFLRWLVACDVAILILLVSFLVVPQVLHNDAPSKGGPVLDFVGGKGIFADSLLFYGHYGTDATVAPGPGYNMAFAYFFTMMCVYLLFLGVLCYRTALSYRHTFIETGGGVRHVFANKMFSGWDFGIATEQAAALNHTSISNELKELLVEEFKEHVKMPLCTKLAQYLVNTVLMSLVLGLILGLGYGFRLLLSMESATSAHWEIVVSTIITAVVCLCPLLFSAIARLEYYKPRTSLYVTLARTCLLDFGTLFLVLHFWSKSGASCWETSVGQEAYRLVLLDAFFSLILLPLFEFIRSFIYKLYPKGPTPEFNIAYNSLTLIYNQAVLWFGMLFSPLLVAAVTIKFLLLFYVKKTVAMHACLPARKIWRAAQTETVLYVLVTLSMFITLFGIGTLFMSTSSQQCGPFQRYEHVYSVLTEGLLRLSENARLRTVLQFLTRPGVIGFLLVCLCIAVYYLRAKSMAQRSMVEILRQMLVIEAKDKDFLLDAIAKVSNGEWLYSPRIDEELPNSFTWKYLHDDKIRKPSNSGFAFDGSRLNHSVLEGARPRSYARENRPDSYVRDESKSFIKGDGDTDSSFSWQGSNRNLSDAKIQPGGSKDWM